MKKRIIVKLVIISLLFFIFYVLLSKPETRLYKIDIIKEKKELLLVDDFVDGINEDYWNIRERGTNYNKELQYYSPKNVTTKNGYLVISGNKENINNHNYTSGLIDTQGKFEFKYGKIIIKAKAGSGKGLLSAIWLLPTDNSLFPEIDMIEVLGNDPKKIWTGVHYLNEASVINSIFKNFKIKDDFINYELNWSENEITCYLNNALVYKTNVGVPDKKMYLLINMAVGGEWPGKPNDKVLPAQFIIDHIIIIPKERELK